MSDLPAAKATPPSGFSGRLPDRLTERLPERDGIPDEERALGEAFRVRYAADTEEVIARRLVPSPKVTLAVISYRAGDYLLDCLRNLRGQTVAGEVPYEILLADSGGLEHLRPRYRNLIDVDLRLRSGLPLNVARNAAAAWARGDLLAYIDDDGLVSPEWLEHALAAFEDPSICVARGRIVPHRHPYFNTYAVHYDRGDALWEDDSLGTEGNMMIRRGAYLAVSGFPDEFYGAEGMHLVYRLKRALPGARAAYVPGMRMEHDYCRTAREFIWKCRRYRSTMDDLVAEDPGLRAFLDDFLRRRKPAPRRTLGELAAQRGLRAAAWAIERMPIFDRVRRR